uniref:adenosylcobinamide-GDP ribazoletransferase n=1 Tax=Thaumasiovibrio occultus TaxID=1891184 RepID=UPI000B3641ED|nr:adenosylcobinamide-GDP ribazoletransferase [Thaumasiovibrio occultus]
MSPFRQQLHVQRELFLIALAFFTRIPIPASVGYSKEKLNQANRYFGLVGVVVGVISAVIFYLLGMLFPSTFSVAGAMVASLLLTGAFHEDGLADVFDGFGGGWTVEQKLNIMKDSRLGTYGAAALFMTLGMKWCLLVAIADISMMLCVLSLIAVHCTSRIVAASLIFSYSYVQADTLSKVKPLANQQSRQDLCILLLSGAPLLLLLPLSSAIWLTLVLILCRQACGIWFQRQLGGYTGDCLGATQQVSELCGYACILATLR